MLFKTKSKEVKYSIYSSGAKTVLKRTKLKEKLATELNELIATINNEFKEEKLPIKTYHNEVDSSVIMSLAVKYYFDYLKTLTDEEIIEFIKNEAINEYGA